MNEPGDRLAGTVLLAGAASAWLCLSLPVFAQEAYYWAYAQRPDLAYFDHPPLVAWLIWLGTASFGDGAPGIRFGTWVCGMVTMLAGLGLLREFGADAAGQRAWIVLGLMVPSLALTKFLANTDPPLVAGWTASMWFLWRARGGSLRAWTLAGVAAGLAMLGKYTGVFLAAGGITVLVGDPEMRRQWLRPGPWLGVLAAAVVFLPVVIWNALHDFESFRFQTQGRLAAARLGLDQLLRCVGLQAGMLHPVVMLALPAFLVWSLRRTWGGDRRQLWLCAFALPLPLWLLVNSLWIEVKANWFTPAYVPLLLMAVLWWRERGAGLLQARPRLCRIAALALWAVPALLPLAPFLRLVPQPSGTSWTGWYEIAGAARHWRDVVDAEDGRSGNTFYFAANYRDAAQLERGLVLQRRDAPDAIAGPVLSQNVFGERALQYDHWEPPARHFGDDAVFALPRPDRRQEMLPRIRARFGSMDMVQRLRVERLGIVVLEAEIWVCRAYRGPCREDAPGPGKR
jgi:dolichol-phosphate mannosyltransferase